jgi:TonB-dependent starch-binding outer membrane protein SusC
MTRLRGLLAVLCAVAVLPSALLAQDRGSITGQVVDQATQRPLQGAQVSVAGTNLGTITNAQGRFLIPNVPTGTREVRVSLIGYQAAPQTVTLAAGQTATVNFAVIQSAIALDELIVTATGERQARREIGNAVSTVRTADVEMATITDATQLLQGRTAGVSVMQSSGQSGTGSRIRIRGSASVSLANDPLLIIDGVRADNSSASIAVGGQNLSRFNDLNPEEIESIEVLKGPAASAMYGTAAANGVLVVTTKRGRAGATRFNAYSEYGTIQDVTNYPANSRGFCSYDTATGRASFGYCTVDLLGDDFLVSRNISLDSVVAFNPLADPRTTPFQDGNRRKIGINAAGGNEGLTYFLSADMEDEDGIYRYNLSTLNRRNLRANLQSQLTSNLNMAVNAGYANSEARLPQNDNNALGVVSGALLSSRIRYDSLSAGYGFGLRPDQIANILTTQNVDRFTGSTTATWSPITWLSFVGTAGLDRVASYDQETVPPGEVPYSATFLEGSKFGNRGLLGEYTANFGGTATYQLGAFQMSTASGVQYSETIARSISGFGARLLAGVPTLGGATARFSVNESNLQVRTIGGYVQQRLNLNDRVFLTGAVRADDNSAFGSDFGLAYYPSISGSWVIAEEPFFPQSDALSSLRLRAAYGQSGLRPGVLDAVRFLNPVAVALQTQSIPGFTIGGAGNVDLRPEKVGEVELGFEAGFLRDRVGLEFTWFNKESRDALIFRRLPPSVGVSQGRRENLGSVLNRGVELLLNARMIDTPRFRWDATVNGSFVRNELTEIGVDPVTGEPLPPIIFGLGGASQRHTVGRPLGAYFARPYTFNDANGDGIITPEELTFTSDTAVYIGSPFPTRELSFSSGVTMFEWLRISGMLDYRGGFKNFNSTDEFRCGSFLNCESLYDVNASLERQARNVATLYEDEAYGFFEDADFVKLRELAFTFTAPRQFAERFRSQGLSLTIAGRNLATWTDYTGFDPEINFAGSGSNFSTAEFLTQPPARTWTARVNVAF